MSSGFSCSVRPRSDRWGSGSWQRIAHAFAVVCLSLACLYLLNRVLGPRVLPRERPFSGTNAQFAFAVPSLLVGWGVVLGFGLFVVGRTTPGRVGWRIDHPLRDVALGLLGFLAIYAILATAEIFVGADPREDFHTILGFSLRERLFFVYVGISAAVTEETIYRGYLQPALCSRFGVAPGIVLTALVFGLAHFQFQPFPLTVKILGAIPLGVLRWKDRSLLAPAVAHAMTWIVLGTL